MIEKTIVGRCIRKERDVDANIPLAVFIADDRRSDLEFDTYAQVRLIDISQEEYDAIEIGEKFTVSLSVKKGW